MARAARPSPESGQVRRSPISCSGAFDQVSHGFGAADSFPILWKHQFFIQDEWKLTPRITMNVGLRYEPWFPWEQEYGRYTSWEYGTQSTVKPDAPRGILFPGDPNVPFKTVENDLNNFAPRLGVAWDVNGNGRTVVRGGYGIYYNHISGTSVHAAEAPWTGTQQLRNGRIEDPHASLNAPVPPSGVPISGEFGCVPISAYPGLNCPLYPLPLNFVYNDLEMATPYVHHSNVSFQRQLTNDFMVDVAYVGRFGYQARRASPLQPGRSSSTRPGPGRRPTRRTSTSACSTSPASSVRRRACSRRAIAAGTTALEFKGTKRMSRGFMFSGFYTLSKAEDTLLDQGAGLTAGVANPFDLTVMKGRSQFDRRHVVGLSWMWEQTQEFENAVVNALLEDWTVSGVHNWSSGNPLNFTMGIDVALDGTGGAGRQLAQFASGKTVSTISRATTPARRTSSTRSSTRARSCRSARCRVGIYGNVPKSAISGPAKSKTDIAVSRLFALPGLQGMRLQFRGELFNAFNQVNFNAPNTTANSPNFGRITERRCAANRTDRAETAVVKQGLGIRD